MISKMELTYLMRDDHSAKILLARISNSSKEKITVPDPPDQRRRVEHIFNSESGSLATIQSPSRIGKLKKKSVP